MDLRRRERDNPSAQTKYLLLWGRRLKKDLIPGPGQGRQAPTRPEAARRAGAPPRNGGGGGPPWPDPGMRQERAARMRDRSCRGKKRDGLMLNAVRRKRKIQAVRRDASSGVAMRTRPWPSRGRRMGDPAIRRSGDPAIRRSGDPAIRRSGDPAIRRSGDPAIRRSGDPAIRRSGDPAIRRSGDPAYCIGNRKPACQADFPGRRRKSRRNLLHASDHRQITLVKGEPGTAATRRRRSSHDTLDPPHTNPVAGREAIECDHVGPRRRMAVVAGRRQEVPGTVNGAPRGIGKPPKPDSLTVVASLSRTGSGTARPAILHLSLEILRVLGQPFHLLAAQRRQHPGVAEGPGV